MANPPKPWKAEYAKSSRSACKTCKSIIDKEVFRIGKMVQSTHFDGLMPVCLNFHFQFFTLQCLFWNSSLSFLFWISFHFAPFPCLFYCFLVFFFFSKVIFWKFLPVYFFFCLVWVSPMSFFTCLMWVYTSWGHDQFSRIGKGRHYGETHSCVHYFDLVSYY